MRYITKQYNSYSCAAIAFCNIIKWLGGSATMKTVRDLKHAGFYDEYGMSIDTFKKLLTMHHISYTIDSKSNLNEHADNLVVFTQDLDYELHMGILVGGVTKNGKLDHLEDTIFVIHK